MIALGRQGEAESRLGYLAGQPTSGKYTICLVAFASGTSRGGQTVHVQPVHLPNNFLASVSYFLRPHLSASCASASANTAGSAWVQRPPRKAFTKADDPHVGPVVYHTDGNCTRSNSQYRSWWASCLGVHLFLCEHVFRSAFLFFLHFFFCGLTLTRRHRKRRGLPSE